MTLNTKIVISSLLLVSLGPLPATAAPESAPNAAYNVAERQAKCTKLDESRKRSFDDMIAKLNFLYSFHCLGWYADTWPTSQDNFHAFSLDVDPKSHLKKRAELKDSSRYKEYLRVTVLDRVRVLYGELQSDINNSDYTLNPNKGSVLLPLRSSMEKLIHNLERGISSGEQDCKKPESVRPSCADKRDQWAYQTGTTGYADATFIPTVIKRDILAPACTGESLASPTCRKAYEAAKRFIQYTSATEFLLRMYVDFKFQELHEELDLYNQQWEKYFGEARSQYVWELKFNSSRYAKKIRKQEGDLAKSGFKPPPNDQWILLHPSVALEYIDSAAQGDRLREALLLEWIGYNRWTWRGSIMHKPMGLSIVTAISDRASTDTLSHGLVFHYNHRFSVGVTYRADSKTGIFITYDLAKHITERSAQIESEFKNRFSDFRVH